MEITEVITPQHHSQQGQPKSILEQKSCKKGRKNLSLLCLFLSIVYAIMENNIHLEYIQSDDGCDSRFNIDYVSNFDRK